MSQRQRRAQMSRRQWHSRAARNMSAAAVVTSAALAVCGLDASTGDGATATASQAGTVTGATQVATVSPVTGVKTAISEPTVLHGLLFYGTAAPGGGKLWETSPGHAAPKLLRTIKGRSDAAPSELTNVDGHLFFEADGELWKSNGTAAGTVAVDTHVDPTALVNADGTAFIETAGGLWKSRGTAAETTEIKALKFGDRPDMEAVSGSVYFTVPNSGAFEYGSTPDLWTSNGSVAGTKVVKQAHVGSDYAEYPRLYLPDDLTNVDGHLYFSASTNLTEASYTDLWEAKGASATRVEPYGSDLTNVSGSLYFFDFNKPYNCNTQEQAEEGGCKAATGYAVWKGTKPIVDFAPGVNAYPDADSPSMYAPYVGELTAVNSTLFFATNLDGTSQLWRTDGTLAGLADIGTPAPHELTNVDGTLFFTSNDGTDATQVWESNGAAPATNGTDAGTTMLTNFPATANADAVGNAPSDLINDGGTLYFTANDGATGGYGLWTLTP